MTHRIDPPSSSRASCQTCAGAGEIALVRSGSLIADTPWRRGATPWPCPSCRLAMGSR